MSDRKEFVVYLSSTLDDLRAERDVALEPLLGHTEGARALAFSPDGRTLVSAGSIGDLFFWDVDPEKPLSWAASAEGVGHGS